MYRRTNVFCSSPGFHSFSFSRFFKKKGWHLWITVSAWQTDVTNEILEQVHFLDAAAFL